jgi:hypothetical protein
VLLSYFLVPVFALAASNDFMADMLAPPGLRPNVKAKYEYRHYDDAGSNHQAFSLRQSKAEISVPIASDPNGNWRAQAGADYDELKTRASFPNNRSMPSRLWDLGAGISHSRSLQNGRGLGGNFSVSSPSDRPFSAGRDLAFSLNAMYRIPGENEAAWILFLSFANNRGFLNYVPLPGAAYSFKAGERTRLVLGVPFVMLFWRPVDPLAVSFFYLPIRTAEIRVTYGPPMGWQPYALASFRTRNFYLHGRADKEEQLFSEEGLFQGGLNVPVAKGWSLDLGGGLAFGRLYFLASKATDRDSAPRLRAENAPFAHLKASASF